MMRYCYLICTLVLSTCFSLLHAQNCNLIPPSNLSISDLSNCSATLHWTSGTTVQKYTVSYRVSGSSQWSPNINVGTNTSYEFTNLLPFTKYDFSVRSKCADGTKSKKVKISTTTLKCSLPDDVIVEGINSNSAKITIVSSCGYDSAYIKYIPIGGAPKILSYPAASSYVLGGLSADTVYLIRVSTCPKPGNNWSATDTLYLHGQPNIVFILLDDSRYDYFSCNGAPSFVHTPNIDRIANEGVNFKKSFVATSLCAPSRATIATGLFTLKTGVTTNNNYLDPSYVTIPEVLQDNGYYTALVGKNHLTFLQGDVPEFNYYLQSVGFEEADGTGYNYNGNLLYIEKEDELTFTDTAIALIERVNDPLFLWLAYRVPHIPIQPMPSFKGDYSGFPIPWKPDTAKYTVNFPSYLYAAVSSDYGVLHGYTLDTTYRDALEAVAGLDSCIGEIFKVLENTNKLENTLIIFMSDNGYMMGSHWLEGKTHAYDPSMRTPLFIRYPLWFEAGSNVTKQFATNMDIAPTIYDAAGVDFEGPMDGHSLRDLYDGTFTRQEHYYLMLHKAQAGAPIKRSIRDQYYKYIHYTCNSDTVEEFFDLVHDSLEITNQINNSAYQSIIEIYRAKYDSIRIAWNDTTEGTVKDCFIENPFALKELYEEAEELPLHPVIYPNLTAGSVELYVPWPRATITLYDSFGSFIRTWEINGTYSKASLNDLPDGIYLLNFAYGDRSVTEKVVVMHR
ncbi:MAG TPA: sulfatase-like hydrolase/transferase [Chitinophagales bacterium]|nr:sulfatase-like hydrolase/transferase [Chitinophagales bacterium]